MPNDLPTRKQFREKTKHPKLLRMRGTIAEIDLALVDWHADKSLLRTLAVYKACRHWLKAKAHKNSTETQRRRIQIGYLIDNALMWVQSFDPDLVRAFIRFNAKKQQAPPPAVKAMAGVYKHERSLYVQSGKTHAPSATLLDNRYDPTMINGKEFGELTEDEFAALDRHFQSAHAVVYLTKMDRLKDMVFAQNGRLVTYNGTPFTTTGGGGWPYAMDVYGNLFAKNIAGTNQQYNHSSFNAGNDVVCAGMIRANEGALVCLSNNSGHYKPSRHNLFNAVQALRDEVGADETRESKAELWDFAVAPGMIVIYEFPFAQYPVNGYANGIEIHRMPAPH